MGRAVTAPREGSPTTIYKILPPDLWDAFRLAGRFTGSPVDIRDGFIHFSTADQVRETAAKHFADQTDLVLVAVAVRALGSGLRWEASRGGALFPHLYTDLRMDAVRWTGPISVGADGHHVFPTLEDE